MSRAIAEAFGQRTQYELIDAIADECT